MIHLMLVTPVIYVLETGTDLIESMLLTPVNNV